MADYWIARGFLPIVGRWRGLNGVSFPLARSVALSVSRFFLFVDLIDEGYQTVNFISQNKGL
jgi:hypothetical protein